MATTEIVQKSVEATFKEMKKYFPEDYAKIEADPRFKESITEAATRASRERVEFDRNFEFLQNRGQDVVSLLKEMLSSEYIQLIKEALNIPTFDMTLEKIPKGDKHVMLAEFKMEDEEFLPPLKIETNDGINQAEVLQYASIVIEGVTFVEQVAGIRVAVSNATMKSAINNAATKIKESSALQEALNHFVESWRRAGSDNWAKAGAFFLLLKALKDLQLDELLMTIRKSSYNCKEMSWKDWVKTSAKVTAITTAALAGSEAALTATIFLALEPANRLRGKICNIEKLEEFAKYLCLCSIDSGTWCVMS